MKGKAAYPIAQCNNSYIFPGIGLGNPYQARRESEPGADGCQRARRSFSPLVSNGGDPVLPG